MSNPNPIEARRAKRDKARSNLEGMDLQELRLIFSDFLTELAQHLQPSPSGEPVTLETLTKVGYLLSQASGNYIKLIRDGDLADEVQKLRQEMNDVREASRRAQIPA